MVGYIQYTAEPPLIVASTILYRSGTVV